MVLNHIQSMLLRWDRVVINEKLLSYFLIFFLSFSLFITPLVNTGHGVALTKVLQVNELSCVSVKWYSTLLFITRNKGSQASTRTSSCNKTIINYYIMIKFVQSFQFHCGLSIWTRSVPWRASGIISTIVKKGNYWVFSCWRVL